MGFLTCCSPCRGHSAQLHGDCQLVVKNMWTMWLNTLGVHLMEGKWQEGPTEWESPSWKKCLWDGFGATVVNSCNMSSYFAAEGQHCVHMNRRHQVEQGEHPLFSKCWWLLEDCVTFQHRLSAWDMKILQSSQRKADRMTQVLGNELYGTENSIH